MAPFPLHRPVVMSAAGRRKLNDLSDDFVKQFKPKECKISIEPFLQTDFRTHGIQAPRPFQLKCAVTLGTGCDLMCTAGCGAGKTLVWCSHSDSMGLNLRDSTSSKLLTSMA